MILSRYLFLFRDAPERVSCLYALARNGSILGDVLPMMIDDDAFGAIAIMCEKRRPVPAASGASPLSLPSEIFA